MRIVPLPGQTLRSSPSTTDGPGECLKFIDSFLELAHISDPIHNSGLQVLGLMPALESVVVDFQFSDKLLVAQRKVLCSKIYRLASCTAIQGAR